MNANAVSSTTDGRATDGRSGRPRAHRARWQVACNPVWASAAMVGVVGALIAAWLWSRGLIGTEGRAEPVASATAGSTQTLFQAHDVWLESTVPFASYQVTVVATLPASGGVVRLVGVEGGEHPLFSEAPVFDPAALNDGSFTLRGRPAARVTIAALTVEQDASRLPSGDVRVARLHLEITGGEPLPTPAVEATLIAAGDVASALIDARVSTRPAPTAAPVGD